MPVSDTVFRQFLAFEGSCEHLYRDRRGAVKIGLGCALANPGEVVALPLRRDGDGADATDEEKRAEWGLIMLQLPGLSLADYRPHMKLRLAEEGIAGLFERRYDHAVAVLTNALPAFPTYPESVRSALVDMAYTVGPERLFGVFPKFIAAIRENDWHRAAAESQRAGVSDARNETVRTLLLETALRLEPSGRAWVDRFPTSRSTADLVPAFRDGVNAFLAALRDAGASTRISATLRPPQRAHLMHYCWRIAKREIDPEEVPPYPGVAIDWVHRTADGRTDLAASRAAAEAMRAAYGMAHRAALRSRHIDGRAIDMTISWSGTLRIRRANGSTASITTTPRTGNDNTALHAVGATYGVVKLATDPPHWSDDGH